MFDFDLSQTSLNLAKSTENVNDPKCKPSKNQNVNGLKTRRMANRKLTLLDLKQSKVAAWPIDVR